MARGTLDRREYAIKFFVSKQGFEAEKELYLNNGAQGSALAQFLPKVRTFIPASCHFHAVFFNAVVIEVLRCV
jgi:membrane protein DedA with SNARE-associated domain